MSENLYHQFQKRFPSDLNSLFIETEDGTLYSYGQLEQQSAHLAHLFGTLGLHKGDRVAVQVDKSPQAVFLYLACLRTGLIFLPLNPAYKKHEMEYFLDNSDPGLVVVSPQSLETIKESLMGDRTPSIETLDDQGKGTLMEKAYNQSDKFDTVKCSGDDIASILYTSGTTGKPKGAMITHRNLSSNAMTLHQYWAWQPNDVLLHALPIFHVHGLFVACNCVLMNGSGMIFLPKFDAKKIIKYLPRSTVMMGVPTFYTRLLACQDFTADICSNMRLFISGSAPLQEQTFEAFRRRIGHTIIERYGMTETGMNTSNPLNGKRMAGTVGFPLPGISARVVDNNLNILPAGGKGNLEIKGPNVFPGYWRMPEKTAEDFTADGYFKTGDISIIDKQGYVSIVGRTKDLVISGGYNIYPQEVELCIDEMKQVQESAVIGIPHPDFGEAVTAVVVRRSQDPDLTEEALIQHVKANLATYKVPKHVFFVDELPRNTMGKVQKKLLRERYENPNESSA